MFSSNAAKVLQNQCYDCFRKLWDDFIKVHLYGNMLCLCLACWVNFNRKDQDPIVQSVVCLTSSLRVILLTVLADSIYNILIFFAEKM